MLRIAVVGPAGSGKSFLINRILGFEAVTHGVSASPVTLDISGHQFTTKDGEQRIELVDTPGLCGQGVTREKIERDVRTHFDSIHMVIVVLGKKRLEPTDMSDIRAMLKFFNHQKNPDKFLFLVNERRNKGSNQETKEANLRSCLNLLEVDNCKILELGRDPLNDTSNSLAMTVSNEDNEDFKEEVKQIRGCLHAANEMKNLLQLQEKTASQKYSRLFWKVGTAAAAAIFAFFLIRHFWPKKVEETLTGIEKIIPKIDTGSNTPTSDQEAINTWSRTCIPSLLERLVTLKIDSDAFTPVSDVFTEALDMAPDATVATEEDQKYLHKWIQEFFNLFNPFNFVLE